ncbi:hypothetical protein B0H14DRAFT_2594288 [Mycena olivaceomarginata]|nr:hypothetical protein B0H14DRAFT_2594288 [Mycena olivaceomarginata]
MPARVQGNMKEQNTFVCIKLTAEFTCPRKSAAALCTVVFLCFLQNKLLQRSLKPSAFSGSGQLRQDDVELKVRAAMAIWGYDAPGLIGTRNSVPIRRKYPVTGCCPDMVHIPLPATVPIRRKYPVTGCCPDMVHIPLPATVPIRRLMSRYGGYCPDTDSELHLFAQHYMRKMQCALVRK